LSLDIGQDRERCLSISGGGVGGDGDGGNAHLTQRQATHLFQSIYQNVNAALNQIH